MPARALLVSAAWQVAKGAKVSQEYYTQNSICRQQYCVNPIFPGLNDLSLLEQLVWQCSEEKDVHPYMDFCSGSVNYNPALPSPNKTAKPLHEVVKAQDDAASTMFFYHLSGMGYEPWDHQTPAQDMDECVRSVWHMVCYTYFPKAQAGCAKGQASPYQRPCAGPCKTYLAKCGVECCDESLQCVFSHKVEAGKGVSLLQTGYVDSLGPSADCTGTFMAGASTLRAPLVLLLGLFGLQLAGASGPDAASSRHEPVVQRQKATSSARWLLTAAVLSCALLLQGCEVDVEYHAIGNWRQKDNYLTRYEFIPAGSSAGSGILNSCSDPNVPAGDQCSGRGSCKALDTHSERAHTVAFCMCERDWTDPECSTRRKSQTITFFLSLFGGLLGLDYFYLGFPVCGFCKLVTLGGCGVWWLTDVVRTGSGPIYAANHRVAADLKHWVFVLVCITLFLIVGFVASLESYSRDRSQKRKDIMKLHAAQGETFLARQEGRMLGPRVARGRQQFPQGYGDYGSAY